MLLGQSIVLWYGSVVELSLEDFCRLYCFMVAFDRDWGKHYALFLTGRQDVLHERDVLLQLLRFKYKGKMVSAHLDSSGSANTRGNIGLADLVKYGYMTRCTDVRDKIYAFLSLAEDTGKYNIVPDYGKSPADLFFDFLTASYKTEKFWDKADRYLLARRDLFAETLRIQLDCTHADLFSSARFTDIGHTGYQSNGSYDALKSKISWVLRKHIRESPEQNSSQPMILTGPLLEPRRHVDQKLQRYHVSFVMAVLVARNRTQPAHDKNSDLIIHELEYEDVFIAWVHHPPSYHPPVVLYLLGRARDVFDDERTPQEPTDLSVPEGITQYVLDDRLFVYPAPSSLSRTAQVRDCWPDIVQRSLPKVHR